MTGEAGDERQHAATALDGMDGSKDAGEKLFGGWVRLQLHKFTVQPVQILDAFNKKILDQVIH